MYILFYVIFVGHNVCAVGLILVDSLNMSVGFVQLAQSWPESLSVLCNTYVACFVQIHPDNGGAQSCPECLSGCICNTFVACFVQSHPDVGGGSFSDGRPK